MKYKLTKQAWESIGKQAGWGGRGSHQPPPEDINDLDEDEEAKWETFSLGSTPEELIKERVMSQAPNGYPMHIKSQDEWDVIVQAVNQGIDSHLEGFTHSKFDSTTGKVMIHPEEMTTLLRRLYEDGDDEAWSLRTDILSTFNIEEV